MFVIGFTRHTIHYFILVSVRTVSTVPPPFTLCRALHAQEVGVANVGRNLINPIQNTCIGWFGACLILIRSGRYRIMWMNWRALILRSVVHTSVVCFNRGVCRISRHNTERYDHTHLCYCTTVVGWSLNWCPLWWAVVWWLVCCDVSLPPAVSDWNIRWITCFIMRHTFTAFLSISG